MMLRTTTAAVLLAALAAGPAHTQEAETDDDATAEQAAPGAGQMRPGQGMMQGQGMIRGQGMMQRNGAMHGRGMGKRHGRHGRHHGQGRPTLRISTEGKGFEIDFECNAEMAACLEAIDRVYEIAGERRRRGMGRRGGDSDE